MTLLLCLWVLKLLGIAVETNCCALSSSTSLVLEVRLTLWPMESSI